MIRLLGSGAFATVLLAHDDALDAPVAVKVLAENWAHRLDVHERFLQEAQILRRCDSPAVVQVYDLGDLDDGRPYFVMAYADRGTLADRLAGGPVDVATALQYVTGAAAGVAALHEIGVIHRDVKPSNVLLRTGRGGEERVLVADLGMAKEAARASGFTLTAGTPGYMAPEQVTGEGLSVRADVYGLGVLLHELLTGRVPVGGEPDADMPEELGAVLRRALAPDPDQRYADADEFAAALAEPTTAHGLPPAARTSPPPAPATVRQGPADPTVPVPPPYRRRRIIRTAVSVATVAAVAVAGGVLLVQRRPPTVTVHDTTRSLTVAVPADWSGQLQDSGWPLDRFGLPGRQAAALAVAADIERWRDARSDEPGLFVGVVPGVSPSTVLATAAHRTCGSAVDRQVRSGELSGPARRFTSCSGATVAWDEIALSPPGGAYTVYVQVKAPDPEHLDSIDDILASLRVTGVARP